MTLQPLALRSSSGLCCSIFLSMLMHYIPLVDYYHFCSFHVVSIVADGLVYVGSTTQKLIATA